jgi:hypothetical protein
MHYLGGGYLVVGLKIGENKQRKPKIAKVRSDLHICFTTQDTFVEASFLIYAVVFFFCISFLKSSSKFSSQEEK